MRNLNETNKQCSRCKKTKTAADFYAINRSHCIECERKDAKERMQQYNATFRGKASQALRDSRKAVKRIEVETDRKIDDDLSLHTVLWVLSDTTCAYCGKEIPEEERSLEHITPMNYGGSNTLDNITMTCITCNKVKGELPVLLHFIREEVDGDAVIQLVDRIAGRSHTSFKEAFERLGEDAKAYFDYKTQQAIETAGESEVNVS